MATSKIPTNLPSALAWFKELFIRFGKKNPAFFNILAWLGALASLASGIPWVIQHWILPAGIELPPLVEMLINKVMFWCGIITVIIAQLPVPSTETIDEKKAERTGEVKVDAKVLPYTAKVEAATDKKEAEGK